MTWVSFGKRENRLESAQHLDGPKFQETEKTIPQQKGCNKIYFFMLLSQQTIAIVDWSRNKSQWDYTDTTKPFQQQRRQIDFPKGLPNKKWITGELHANTGNWSKTKLQPYCLPEDKIRTASSWKKDGIDTFNRLQSSFQLRRVFYLFHYVERKIVFLANSRFITI